MPGRVLSGNANPGSQIMSIEERPVPAIRRNPRGASGLQNGKVFSDLKDTDDGKSETRELNNSHYDSGTEMMSQFGLHERQRYPVTNYATSFKSPSQPPKPVSTVRPQSAMAFTSSSAVNYGKASFPERPPSSLGISRGPYHGVSGAYPSRVRTQEPRLKSPIDSFASGKQHTDPQSNGHLPKDYSDLLVHHRSLSYGNGVSLGGEGYSDLGYKGEKSEDVYATVSRQQNQGKNTDATPGYVTPQSYERKQQSLVSGQHTFVSPHAYNSRESELNAGHNQGSDNLAFVPEEQSKLSGEFIPSSASTNLDLRSAWQRLYGNSPDLNTSSRHPSADGFISTSKSPILDEPIRIQDTRRQNGHQISQHFGHPHTARLQLHEPVHSPAGPVTSSVQDREHTSHNFLYNSLSPNNQLTAVRESPMGQSSSNPDQTSGSNNSSQLSSYSISNKNMSTFKPQKKKSDSNLDPPIGPASKYPELQKTSVQTPVQPSSQRRNELLSDGKRTGSRQNLASPNFLSKSLSPGMQRNSSTSDVVEFNIPENLTHPSSRFSSAFLDSDASSEDEYSLKPLDSIFDYPDDGSENDSVDAQQSPPSSRVAARKSLNSTPVNLIPKYSHKSLSSVTPSETLSKTPDLLRPSSVVGANVRTTRNQAGGATNRQAEKKQRSHLNTTVKDNQRSHSGQDSMKGLSKKHPTNYARSRSLDDVRESATESVLSFDIENTVLTIEPSDQSEMGTVHSYKSNNSVKAQLSRLEGMYTHVMKALDETAHGIHTRRRWSIGSSDVSSLQHHTRHSRHSRMSTHGLGSKDVRIIGKRFQRLESHVITLARSVAHLSSELRAQNTLSQEIETVKREIQELRSQGSALPGSSGNFRKGNLLLTDFERYHGWVPSVTNPQRVNKLTKFFGEEPPLLEIFLKQLGYEKFLKNFQQEHIGMIELPYMTEERLQTIGIPMGPRLRILQEAQLQFRQGNFNIYFV